MKGGGESVSVVFTLFTTCTDFLISYIGSLWWLALHPNLKLTDMDPSESSVGGKTISIWKSFYLARY